MSNLRELMYFSIAHGDLDHDPDHETGADRIAALARADPLGAALWRVMGSHDVHAFKEAVTLLAHAVPMPWSFALVAVEEWMANAPPTVSKARQVLVEAEARASRQMAEQLGRRVIVPRRSSRKPPEPQ